MEQREGTRERYREGECSYGAKGGNVRGAQGSENMVMGHREAGREANKAVGKQLRSIGKEIERETR